MGSFVWQVRKTLKSEDKEKKFLRIVKINKQSQIIG